MTPNTDVADIKHHLQVHVLSARTYVIAMAIDAQHVDRNKVFRIAVGKGMPIGGYIYDTVGDFFGVRCIDYICLGFIPITCKANMESSEGWSANIPLPEVVIKGYLSTDQLADLNRFKSAYKADCYRIEYLQSVD